MANDRLKIAALRCTDDERDKWERAARKAGLRYSAWARRTLNEQADLELSLAHEVESAPVENPPPRKTRVSPILDIRQPAHRCPPKGMYCKVCNKIT